MVAFATVALVTALAATAASTYVKSESAKGVAKKTSRIRQEEAEALERRHQDAINNTKKAVEELSPLERESRLKAEDEQNDKTLTRIHDSIKETEPAGSDQAFSGKISQGFKDDLTARREKSKLRGEALRKAAGEFNAPVGAASDDIQFLRDLGIDNNTVASFGRGDRNVASARVAGIEPGGLGLAKALDILALVAGGASAAAGAGAGAGAGTGAAQTTSSGFIGPLQSGGSGGFIGPVYGTGSMASRGIAPVNFGSFGLKSVPKGLDAEFFRTLNFLR